MNCSFRWKALPCGTAWLSKSGSERRSYWRRPRHSYQSHRQTARPMISPLPAKGSGGAIDTGPSKRHFSDGDSRRSGRWPLWTRCGRHMCSRDICADPRLELQPSLAHGGETKLKSEQTSATWWKLPQILNASTDVAIHQVRLFIASNTVLGRYASYKPWRTGRGRQRASRQWHPSTARANQVADESRLVKQVRNQSGHHIDVS